MNRNRSFPILRWVSLLLIFIAVILTVLQLVNYSRIRANFPRGLIVAQVPVGGLDQQQASERLLQTYAQPVEIHYGNAVIQIKPSVIGFQLDLETMLSAADLQRVNQPFWEGFWDYLWNRTQAVTAIPLRSTFTEERLRNFLKNEVAVRYDQPPSPASPIPGTVNFQPGQPGTTLDIDRAVALISDALHSTTDRVANLSYSKSGVPRPSLQNLQILLQQIIELSQFTGLVELYMQDLQSNQVIHFTYKSGQKPPYPVDIAFSGWSTIKIPVLVSAFRRLGDPAPADAIQSMERMIERSDNDSTDHLAATVIDKRLAPVLVSDDMQTLGLDNTFWGGFFYPGAPLLKPYETPANQRSDVDTGPDPYDQTSPADLGMLLGDIYQCYKSGGGSLVAAFPGEITQSKCQQMITFLSRNDIPVLIQAGLPDGTQIAHKHGWANETDGLLHTLGDAGIVFSPGGNYILVAFAHEPTQLLFDPVNQMVAEMSRAVYNFFNVPISQ